MPQSLARILVHAVFSTKERRPFLRRTDLRSEMHSDLGGILKQLDCGPVVIGGVEDHVGFSQVESVREYILKQAEHHRRLSFQDEFRRFLERYQIAYDERYVWD